MTDLWTLALQLFSDERFVMILNISNFSHFFLNFKICDMIKCCSQRHLQLLIHFLSDIFCSAILTYNKLENGIVNPCRIGEYDT